jgi:hypothetical protein
MPADSSHHDASAPAEAGTILLLSGPNLNLLGVR